MAERKGKEWETNLYHALVYTATIFIVAAVGDITLPMWVVAMVFVSHFLIDPLKARWKLIKHIWVDQIIHLAILGAIALIV